ncbi:MAG: hypothetical protein LBR19_00195 [Bifidobacteriaceae bacterium]|jgi:hypothetical protein|nr:hypothetical protein [Bifidobacteriaceae bacterium]
MKTAQTSRRQAALRRTATIACALALTMTGAAAASAVETDTGTAGVTLSQPQVTGQAKIGATLTVATTATPADALVTYQWFRGSIAIGGAKAATYTVTAADSGADLVVKVTAVSGTSQVVKYSNHTLIPESLAVSKAELSGTAKVGGTLTADVVYGPKGATVTYIWYRGTSVIGAATGAMYTLTASDAGADIVLKVIATKAGLGTVTKYSNHIQVEQGLTVSQPVATKAQGRVTVSLTVQPTDAKIAYQWFSNGQVIWGAIGDSYVPLPWDKDLVVKVTVTKAGYPTVIKYSNHITS